MAGRVTINNFRGNNVQSLLDSLFFNQSVPVTETGGSIQYTSGGPTYSYWTYGIYNSSNGTYSSPTLTMLGNNFSYTGPNAPASSNLVNEVRISAPGDMGGFPGANPVATITNLNLTNYNFNSTSIHVGLYSHIISDNAVDYNGSLSTSMGDYFTGSAFDDVAYGRQGNDFLGGQAGRDKLYGNQGLDQLAGGNGADELYGGEGADQLSGGRGADYLDGGNGFDAAVYIDADAGVTLDLVYTSLNTGFAQGDVLVNIEGILGSNHNDTLSGNELINLISGGAGSDHIYGRKGADHIEGGNGDDHLFGGQGRDTFYTSLNGGHDTVYDFDVARPERIGIISTPAFDSYSEMMAVATQQGSNTLFTFDSNTSLLLLNVQQIQLTSDNFVFSSSELEGLLLL